MKTKSYRKEVINIMRLQADRKRGGFSLIEVIIICFIITTLFLLAGSLVSRSREFAKTMVCANNMKQLVQAMEIYHTDWKKPPNSLSSLYPQYVNNSKTFFCPRDADRKNAGEEQIEENNTSYSNYFVARSASDEDINKIFFCCPRHFKGKKTVTASLSYAVNIDSTQEVLCNGKKANFGQTYNGGDVLTFKDGTQLSITSGKVGLLASLVDVEEKIYSIVYVPENEDSEFTVDHEGDSRFEVITPAVIAGVAGTKFTVLVEKPTIDDTSERTIIQTLEGIVIVEDRKTGSVYTVTTPDTLDAQSDVWNWNDYIVWLRQEAGITGKPPRITPKKNKFKIK